MLTAAHVVFGDDRQPLAGVQVGLPDAFFSGQVVWPASYDTENGAPEWDAALVEITDPAWTPRHAAVSWGRVTGRSPIAGCTATGFPRAKIDPDRGARDSDQIRATINPGSNVMTGLLELDIDSAVPKQLADLPSPWSGASGAGLFANGLLFGILLSDERHAYSGDRLRATPIRHLATDPDFRRCLSNGNAGLRAIAEIQSVELARILTPPAGARAKRRQGFSPASLLRPEAETVPFSGRDELVDDLLNWCTTATVEVDLRLLFAPGGQGKTRLARHLAQKLASLTSEAGLTWLTGFLESDPMGSHRADLARIADTNGPLLVVVDYAESRPDQVARLMESLWTADSSYPARVLLLARSVGDWWVQLTDQLDLPREGIDKPLTGLHASETRETDFHLAVRSFAEELTEQRHSIDWVEASRQAQIPRDLNDSRYGSPLALQLTALTSLLDAAEHNSTPGDEPAEEALLRHESRYWIDSATASRLVLSSNTFRDLIAVSTLAGAATSTEAAAVLAAVSGLTGASGDIVARASTWLRDLYPPRPDQWWGSLQPDRVAEYHAATSLLNDPSLLDRLLTAASHTQRHQALTLLSLALANPAISAGRADRLTAQLTRTLRDGLEQYGPIALQLVPQMPSPAPFVKALESATVDTTTEVLGTLVDALPKYSVTLAPLAEQLTSRLVDRYRTQEMRSANARSELATALKNHSVWLARLGQGERALETINEAVDLYRELAATRPDTYTPDLAMALGNQSNRLSDLGQHEQALETITNVVALFRDLAATDPDAYTDDVAMALGNQSIRLSTLGQHEQALEAINEAVDLFRELAAARHDVYTSDVAQALNHQSIEQAELGQDVQALETINEAVDLFRELAATRPDTYTPDLAMALGNQSNRLSDLGQHEQALEAINEAVDLYRELAATRPDTYTPDLASALKTLGIRTTALGGSPRR